MAEELEDFAGEPTFSVTFGNETKVAKYTSIVSIGTLPNSTFQRTGTAEQTIYAEIKQGSTGLQLHCSSKTTPVFIQESTRIKIYERCRVVIGCTVIAFFKLNPSEKSFSYKICERLIPQHSTTDGHAVQDLNGKSDYLISGVDEADVLLKDHCVPSIHGTVEIANDEITLKLLNTPM